MRSSDRNAARPVLYASDLRAIGWVVARDTLVDAVRGALGAARWIEPDVLASLGRQWQALENVHAEERARSPITLAASPRTALTTTSASALAAFVRRLVAECPARYSAASLQVRCRAAAAQSAIGFVASAWLLHTADTPDSLSTDAGLVLILMGVWSLINTLQLSTIYRIAKRLHDGVAAFGRT